MMRFALLASAAFVFVSPALAAQPNDSEALEKNFDGLISASDQQQWLEQMSSEPNQVGSPHDKANADFELAMFKQWGWDAHIERFDVLYPTPISTSLELVTPQHLKLGGQEPPVAEDPSSAHMAGALPPYVAYRATETSLHRLFMSIMECRPTMMRSSSAESASKARSSSPATERAGAG